MSRSKNINTYPLEYFQLIDALDGSPEFTLEFPTQKAAEKERFTLYAFMTGLKKASQNEEEYPPEKREEFLRLWQKGQNYAFCLRGDKLKLIHRSCTPEALQAKSLLSQIQQQKTSDKESEASTDGAESALELVMKAKGEGGG